MLPPLTLVLGGARSGKSALAERLLSNFAGPKVYLASAEAHDAEMAARIEKHRANRQNDGWQTREAPLSVARELAEIPPGTAILFDCATLWLSNHLLNGSDVEAETATLLDALAQAGGPVAIVSNEVGGGIVPENALARQFRDAQGHLNQAIAARADLVVAVMAGLPLVLKGQLPETFRP